MFGAAGFATKTGRNMLSSFLHPERAYEKGQEQLNNYYNQGQSYLQPYNEGGQAAYDPMYGAMQNLLNPTDLFADWMGQYETSPWALDEMERAKQLGLDALAANGMLGSTPGAQAMQAGANQIANADKQNWFKMMLEPYMHGAKMSQDIWGTGANVAGNMANNANAMGQNSANLAYGKAAAPGRLFENLLNTSIQGASGMAGGGGGGWSTTGGAR